MPVHVYASLIQNEVFHLWVFNSFQDCLSLRTTQSAIYFTYTGKPLPKPIQCSYIVCNTSSDTASTPENILPEDLGVVIKLKQSAK